MSSIFYKMSEGRKEQMAMRNKETIINRGYNHGNEFTINLRFIYLRAVVDFT